MKQQKLHPNRSLLGSNNRTTSGSPLNSGTSTPRLGSAPTSAPAGDSAARLQAMRTPFLHFLAVKPSIDSTITDKTRIPKDDCTHLLQKFGKQVDGRWQLTDRAYKELDVWNFGYSTQADRQAAVDNAVKAFDRMRLGKDEKIWQMLLPKEERNKGKVLSRLHLGSGAVNRGLTPNAYGASPMPNVDGANDGTAASGKNTPKVGPSGTPRTGAAKANAITKRLLSKDPKKARAVEDAKEKARKEKDAAASDRESKTTSKKTAAKKSVANPKIKSADVVHSSDEDEDEDPAAVMGTGSAAKVASKSTASSTAKLHNASSSESEPKKAAKKPAQAAAKRRPTNEGSEGSDAHAHAPTKGVAKAIARRKTEEDAAKKKAASPAVHAAKPAKPDTLSAPSSQNKNQLSPKKADSRPPVPSPLGAARPRVASDVSNTSAIGVQRSKYPAETPQVNGARPRHDTVTSSSSYSSNGTTKKRPSSDEGERGTDKPRNPAVNGSGHADAVIAKSAMANGTPGDSDSKLKRKANDLSSDMRDQAPPAKHRKTNSSSSQSQPSSSLPMTALTSPDDHTSTGSDDSAPAILELTYERAVDQADKFLKQFYPAYTKLYDEQAGKEARGETVSKEERGKLWSMHRRLESMKREIQLAAERQRESG